jgi:3-oxoacyl-[acyl-carrier protein] reductase
MDLSDKTALVTGASRNIGRATAVRLAEAGADVGVSARSDRDGCAETAERVRATGSDAAVALADLAEPDDIEAMVETVRDRLGPIDVLVNNATTRPDKPFLAVDRADLEHVMNVNFRGIFLTTQQVVPDMLEAGGGSIVNLLGAMVYLGEAGRAHSYGSKMAIEGMVRQLASEFGPDGIRVNGLSPGIIDTGREGDAEWDRLVADLVAATPLGRPGEPEEIANACCFLASDQASFVSGQVIHANGGIYPTPSVLSHG